MALEGPEGQEGRWRAGKGRAWPSADIAGPERGQSPREDDRRYFCPASVAAQLPSIVSPEKARFTKGVESGSEPFTVAEWSKSG